MAIPIQMPALSPTMKEGKITRWLKKEGDKISSGTAIAEVETDKSNLEVEAFDDGYLVAIAVKEGEMAAVGAPIAWIGAKDEKVDVKAGAPVAAKPALAPAAAPAPAAPAPAAKPVAAVAVAPAPVATAAPAPVAAPAGGRVRASPLARKMAAAQGLDVGALAGSGPNGRIVKRDVEAAVARGGAPRAAAAPVVGARMAPEVQPLSNMRRVIAQRMSEVKPGVPHFYLTVDVDMAAALQIREEAKALESKVSVNDIIVKAAAVALRRVPKMNAQFGGDHVLQLHDVDVGIAVAIEDGLVTPIVRNADQKTLSQISAEGRDLAERARGRKLKPEEYAGGSLTVSNLGMFGIDQFVAVINPPQAAILAVGQVAERPVVKNGQLAVGKVMTVTLSGDHRVIDGALGAVYLKELKALLEHPMRLLF
jgi:pyruvate dehydrogenase E2 component (dihydrolipoamide acetyltransferase)